MINLTPLIVAVITLCAALITGFLVPYLKTKLSAAKFEKLCSLVTVGVKAAEQLYKEGGIKLDERTDHVLEYLRDHGFSADIDEIMDVIKSAVLDLPPTHSLVGDKKEKDE